MAPRPSAPASQGDGPFSRRQAVVARGTNVLRLVREFRLGPPRRSLGAGGEIADVVRRSEFASTVGIPVRRCGTRLGSVVVHHRGTTRCRKGLSETRLAELPPSCSRPPSRMPSPRRSRAARRRRDHRCDAVAVRPGRSSRRGGWSSAVRFRHDPPAIVVVDVALASSLAIRGRCVAWWKRRCSARIASSSWRPVLNARCGLTSCKPDHRRLWGTMSIGKHRSIPKAARKVHRLVAALTFECEGGSARYQIARRANSASGRRTCMTARNCRTLVQWFSTHLTATLVLSHRAGLTDAVWGRARARLVPRELGAAALLPVSAVRAT